MNHTGISRRVFNFNPEAGNPLRRLVARMRAGKPRLAAIAPPQSAARLMTEVAELAAEQVLLRSGEFLVFHAVAAQIPCLLKEIGRLREITFRHVGEGTGKARDLDQFDAHYTHLCLWNHERGELAGAYRLTRADHSLQQLGKAGLYTLTLFEYETELFDRLGPALELGRSFVRPEYQRSISALFLLWKGIGQYILRHPQYKILFGPVSISNHYETVSRQLMVEFLQAHHYERELAARVSARNPFPMRALQNRDQAVAMNGDVEALAAMISALEPDQKSIPVLLKQYLKLGGKLLAFNIDQNFSDVLDGLIMVDLTQTDRRTLERYLGEAEAARFLAFHTLSPVAVCA